MQTLIDTSLLHHMADRHRLPTATEREAHALTRPTSRARLLPRLAALFRLRRPHAVPAE